jgi:hypothetical protein
MRPIFIGYVAKLMNIDKIWKPGVSFSLFPRHFISFDRVSRCFQNRAAFSASASARRLAVPPLPLPSVIVAAVGPTISFSF